MDQLKQQAAHLIIVLLVVVAMLILALKHVISGAEAYGAILGIGGMSAGGAIGSSSGSAPMGTATVSVPVRATVQESKSSSTPVATDGVVLT